MSTDLLPRSYKAPKENKLQEVTFRGFGGGWNTIHDDISMDPRYLPDAKNIIRTPSGAATIRYGTKWYCDATGTATGVRVIDMAYFNGRLICVTNTGQIFTVDHPVPTKTLIWSPAIAAALPGAPTGWNVVCTQVTFVPFKDKLIVHNGTDKPVRISNNFVVTYLQDLASGSNVNVPVGKYGCTVSNYHCVAGILSASPTLIYVSHAGTDGTFPGDAAPNDAISFDVGAYAPEGALAIRGIAGFRTNLIVFFQGQALVITLGEYEGAIHTPKFPDTMPQFGLLGHRCVAKLSHDLLFHGMFGTSSARRNLFSGLYDTKHLNEYIEPSYRQQTGGLDDQVQQLGCFTIFDPSEHSVTLFLPSGKAFTYAFNEELRYRGWSYYEQQEWDSGCSTFVGRVFFARGMRIYQKGNGIFPNENYHADRISDRDKSWLNATHYYPGDLILDPLDSTIWKCLLEHGSAAVGLFGADRNARPAIWEPYLGTPISFSMELPWIDGRDPMKVKQLRFGKVGTKGTAEFKLQIFVDNLFKDETGAEIYLPAISLDMMGQDVPGYGTDAGPFGAGRPSNDARLYAIPCKFKTIKFRYTGSTTKTLTIAHQSYLFSKGKFRR